MYGIKTERLPGVAGTACTESNRVNHGRSGNGLCSRQSNYPLGIGIPIPEFGTVHSSDDERDNITLAERRELSAAVFVREKKADTVLKEVSRVI